MTAWLHIIGFGEGDPLPPLPPADIILGPARAIERLSRSTSPLAGEAGRGGAVTNKLEPWRSLKLEAMIAQTLEHRGTHTLLLASGDPPWFGFGAPLERHL